MNRSRLFPTLPALALLIAPMLLTACNTATQDKPHIELPQQFRLPPNDTAKMFEPRVGRIAITGEDGNITVMDQAGENIVQITRDGSLASDTTNEANVYSLPVWSPDAKQLALVEFTGRRTAVSTTVELNPDAVMIQRGANSQVIEQSADGTSNTTKVEPGMRVERNPARVIIQSGTGGGEFVSSALYVASADGKRPLREIYVSDKHDVPYLDWAPDSSQIAFLAQNVQDQSVSLNLIKTQEGSRSKVMLEGTSAAWDWSPDSKTLIAKVGASGGSDRLSIVDTASDQTTKLPSKGDSAFQAPAFSPDGGYLLLTEPNDKKQKLVLADRVGKTIKTLADFTGRIAFAWSPAGAKVAYVIQADDTNQGGPLTVVDVNSGEKRVISNKPVQAFFWSPDGQRIAVFSRATPTDIPPGFQGFSAVPQIATPLMLLETVDPKNGTARGLFYFAPTTAFQRVSAEFDRWSRGVNIWSPDSRKLAFTLAYGNSSGSRDYVIESEASGSLYPRILGNGGLAFWSPK